MSGFPSDFAVLASSCPFPLDIHTLPHTHTLPHPVLVPQRLIGELMLTMMRRGYSQQLFQLIHMAKSPAWGFSAETSVGLPGAHGSELVRSFCVFDQEQAVFTAGEDGQIIAWRPN